MYDKYLTERLQLRILFPSDARMVADFYARNFDDFKNYEPMVSDSCTKISYQRQLLEMDGENRGNGTGLRFFVFEKDDPFTVIGTVSFRDIRYNYYQCATIGYKMDQEYRNMGYATEAISNCLSLVKEELGLRRIEATVLPDNYASARVLGKLGFIKEGYLHDKIFIEGQWRDHLLFARVMD